MQTILIPGEASSFRNYAVAVEAVGGRAVFWTPEQSLPAFDGLLLPGGGDVAARRYGQEDRACAGVDLDRDALEFSILDCAVSWRKPVLGICRGAQVINVYFGGSLIQDMNGHRRTPWGQDRLHRVWTEPSFLRAWCGGPQIVNSAHHQAMARLGTGLRAVQYAADGTVEAVEHAHLPVWGVQWHPERTMGAFAKAGVADGSQVLRAFLKNC